MPVSDHDVREPGWEDPEALCLDVYILLGHIPLGCFVVAPNGCILTEFVNGNFLTCSAIEDAVASCVFIEPVGTVTVPVHVVEGFARDVCFPQRLALGAFG